MRLLYRLPLLLLAFLLVAPLPLLWLPFAALSRRALAAAGTHTLRLWSKLFCAALGVRVRAEGERPGKGSLVVANHLSYLDILVLGSLYPTAFLSMAEVADWPVVGQLARLVGTLFIERRRTLAVGRANDELAQYLGYGLSVTIFPEARPSPGEAVGPFHSSLLQVAVERDVPCVPASLSYDCPPPAEPSSDVCWWGEMSFGPHFLKLARLPRVEARVRFGAPVARHADRKALARTLQGEVAGRFDRIRGVRATGS